MATSGHAMTDHDIDDQTRRTILQALGGAVGVAATGALASGHPRSEGSSEDHDKLGGEPNVANTELAGYHSLGGIGSESFSGDPDSPHYGGLTELRIHEGRGLAFVGIFSSRDSTEDRGMAIVDVSGYLSADDAAAAADTEMTVLSFLRNDNPASAFMDVKVSDDGQYVFACKQSVTALFNPPRGVGEGANTDNESNSPQGDSLQVIDVSDPGNPEYVASWDVWGGVGPHNCTYHRIGGGEYVFATKGTTYVDAAIYVFEFDRASGTLREINVYTLAGNARQGSPGLNQGNQTLPAYSHDLTIVNDPVTGTPTGYWANWAQGARILDVSDPANIQELGYARADDATGANPSDDWVAHYVEPAPTLVDGKRVFLIGEERSSASDARTGYYLLAEADSAFASDESTPVDILDSWTLLEEATFQNFTLSPHNVDINDQGQVAAGHYHGGTRFFEIHGGHGNNDGPGENGKGQGPDGNQADQADQVTSANHGLSAELHDIGHHREPQIVPEASESAVSQATPFHWCSELANGLAFTSGINTGVYVLDNGDIEVGRNPMADVDVERGGAADAYTQGQTLRIELDVETDRPIRVRDRIPAGWTVDQAGSDHVTYTEGGAQYVEFTAPVDGEGRRTAFVEVSGGPGSFTVGPVEYTLENGPDTWRGLFGTLDSNVAAGISTEVL